MFYIRLRLNLRDTCVKYLSIYMLMHKVLTQIICLIIVTCELTAAVRGTYVVNFICFVPESLCQTWCL